MLCFIIILLSWKAWRDSQTPLSIIGNAYTRPVTVFLCITTQYTDLEPPIQITLNNRQEHYTVTHASTFKPERGKFCVLCAFNSVLYILARMSGSISRQSGRRFIGEFISITGSEVHVFAAEGVLAVSLLRQMQKSVLTTDKKVINVPWYHLRRKFIFLRSWLGRLNSYLIYAYTCWNLNSDFW